MKNNNCDGSGPCIEGHTPTPWATDGRMIVQEVEGASFWSGQSYIADCKVSESYRGKANTEANAAFIVLAVNTSVQAFEALEVAAALIRRVSPKSVGALNQIERAITAMSGKAV